MTPYQVCEKARFLLDGMGGLGGPYVRVTLRRGDPVVGELVAVSPVNAWIKVGRQRIFADHVKRIEERA